MAFPYYQPFCKPARDVQPLPQRLRMAARISGGMIGGLPRFGFSTKFVDIITSPTTSLRDHAAWFGSAWRFQPPGKARPPLATN